jgi:hypothetical protein
MRHMLLRGRGQWAMKSVRGGLEPSSNLDARSELVRTEVGGGRTLSETPNTVSRLAELVRWTVPASQSLLACSGGTKVMLVQDVIVSQQSHL